MTYRLENRVAVITGGATGIGEAAAVRLAAEGAAVEILDLDDSTRVCDEIQKRGGRASSQICDVTNEEQIAQAVSNIEQRHGKADILVNNAGILSGRHPWHTLSKEEVNRFVQVNYIGYFLMSKAIYP